MKCAARRSDFLFEHHCEFTGTHQLFKTVSGLPFQHLTVLKRLQHVAVQAETLQATTIKLKDDACKAPLLTKISQSSSRDGPRDVDSPSSSRKQPAASGGATRAACSAPDEWFDPNTIKEMRELRLNAASSTLAATFDPTPLRRSRSKAVKGIKKSSIPRSADFDKQSAKNSAKVSAIALNN